MSMTTIPRHADLRRLAAAGANVEGSIALTEFARLRDALAGAGGVAEIALGFGLDDEGYRTVTGSVRASLPLQCQRCLEQVAVAIDASVSLALVWREDEIPSLPARYEGLVVGTEPVDLYELIEEELLLGLPLVPRHEADACSMAASVPSTGSADGDAVRENPFAAALRRR
jgi:uncharacterized protein